MQDWEYGKGGKDMVRDSVNIKFEILWYLFGIYIWLTILWYYTTQLISP